MRIFQNDASTIIEFLTDSKGRVNTNVRCPVSCGRCCGYWKDVSTFDRLVRTIYPQHDECPHLTDHGCKLPRRKRPIECTTYLCELGLLAVHDLVTDDEAASVVAEDRQLDAFSYLNRRPPTRDSKSLKELKFKPKAARQIRRMLREGEEKVEVAKVSIEEFPDPADRLWTSQIRSAHGK